MRRLKKIIPFFSFCLILIFPGYIYFTQESQIFRSKVLPTDFIYQWDQPFEEHYIKVEPNIHLNALFFPSEQKKGLVFYLHGRGGNLAHPWGAVAKNFTDRGYDCFIFDYRGFGKSDGKIHKEQILLSDAEKAYHFAVENFPADKIIFYGRSLGTGLATYLASKYFPHMLILESPYLSLLDTAVKSKPYLPKFLINILLKYPLRTDLWITSVTCPIYIFHGTADRIIPYNSSLALEKLCPPTYPIKVTLFKDVTHNHVVKNQLYQSELDQILQ
ncbi:MAG: alpha/beta fold hydrolase [Simkaniaceae bacterium]